MGSISVTVTGCQKPPCHGSSSFPASPVSSGTTWRWSPVISTPAAPTPRTQAATLNMIMSVLSNKCQHFLNIALLWTRPSVNNLQEQLQHGHGDPVHPHLRHQLRLHSEHCVQT